jgi:hypothetical protein
MSWSKCCAVTIGVSLALCHCDDVTVPPGVPFIVTPLLYSCRSFEVVVFLLLYSCHDVPFKMSLSRVPVMVFQLWCPFHGVPFIVFLSWCSFHGVPFVILLLSLLWCSCCGLLALVYSCQIAVVMSLSSVLMFLSWCTFLNSPLFSCVTEIEFP